MRKKEISLRPPKGSTAALIEKLNQIDLEELKWEVYTQPAVDRSFRDRFGFEIEENGKIQHPRNRVHELLKMEVVER